MKKFLKNLKQRIQAESNSKYNVIALLGTFIAILFLTIFLAILSPTNGIRLAVAYTGFGIMLCLLIPLIGDDYPWLAMPTRAAMKFFKCLVLTAAEYLKPKTFVTIYNEAEELSKEIYQMKYENNRLVNSLNKEMTSVRNDAEKYVNAGMLDKYNDTMAALTALHAVALKREGIYAELCSQTSDKLMEIKQKASFINVLKERDALLLKYKKDHDKLTSSMLSLTALAKKDRDAIEASYRCAAELQTIKDLAKLEIISEAVRLDMHDVQKEIQHAQLI